MRIIRVCALRRRMSSEVENDEDNKRVSSDKGE